MTNKIITHTQSKRLVKATGILAIVGFTLAAASCGNGVGTHQMGPPGKSHTMSDDQMPSRAR